MGKCHSRTCEGAMSREKESEGRSAGFERGVDGMMGRSPEGERGKLGRNYETKGKRHKGKRGKTTGRRAGSCR